MNPIQNYFLNIPEPEQSMLLYIRDQILHSCELMSETFSFQLPFLKYKGKMLCFFHYSKKHKCYYLSFYHGDRLQHPLLLSEGRKKFKILLINPDEDIPIDLIMDFVNQVKAMTK